MYSIMPALVSALFLGYGLYVVAEKGFTRVSTSFLILCITTVFWQTTWAVLFQVDNTQWAGILVKAGYLLILFLPTSLYQFLTEISERQGERRLVFTSYAIAAVLAVLDLSDSADSLKGGELGQPGPYGGIAVYKQQIEQALAGKGKIRQKDFMGHGTLVAGTAAASSVNWGGEYGGVAPAAELIGAKVTPTPRDSVFSDVYIMNALAFIDSVAGARGIPWVANMSFGSELGAHDGTDPLERFIASYVNSGQPGRAVAVSSGNSRQRAVHASGDFTTAAGDSLVLELAVSGGTAKPDHVIRLEIWLSAGHPGLSFSLLSPAGRRYGPYPDGYASDDTLLTQDAVLIVENAKGGPYPDNGDRLVAVEFYDLGWWDSSIESDSLEIAAGTWKIALHSNTGLFEA